MANSTSLGSPVQPVAASRVADFIGSIGVNTHLSWWDTAWGVGNGQWAGAETKVMSELSYIGIDLVRDGVPAGSGLVAEYAALAEAGIHFDLIQTVTNGQVELAGDVASMSSFSAAHPDAIVSYEGANEYNINHYTLDGQNSYGNLAWGLLDAQATQQAVNANAQLASSGVKLVASSTANSGTAPDVSAYVNFSNWHVYGGVGEQLQNNIASAVNLAHATAPGAPVAMTEVGISSAALSQSSWGVAGNEAIQGLIDTNAVLDAYKDGVQQTFLYDLMDNNNAADQEDNFGLFNADGTPKSAATDLHNLISILTDYAATAGAFRTGSLDYSVQNLPSTASSMLLEKSSGAYDIVLWNGNAKLLNPSTGSVVMPPISNVTVQLGATYGTVKMFDPIVGTAPVQILHNVSSVSIGLSADPLIVEVEPNPASTTYQPGAKGGTVDSLGNDTVQVGAGAVTVNATGPSIDIKGSAGKLTYQGTASATIHGGSGAMNVTLNGSGSNVAGGSGGMTVIDEVGGNTITGAVGNGNNGINITTTKGNDLIITGAWTAVNTIRLGSGNDTVVANGTSTVMGSIGNDIITVNGWFGDITTSTGGSSQVAMNAPGIVRTHGLDTIIAASALTLQAGGPSTTLTAGSGYVWLSGTGTITATGGSGGGNFDFTRSSNAVLTTAKGATDAVWLGSAAATITAKGNDTIHGGSGADTISALAGTATVAGSVGKMSFIQGQASSSVIVGSGQSVFDFVNGQAGGSLMVAGFRLGTDALHLQGYAGSSVKTEQVVGGSTQIVLTDNTKITLLGLTNPQTHSLWS